MVQKVNRDVRPCKPVNVFFPIFSLPFMRIDGYGMLDMKRGAARAAPDSMFKNNQVSRRSTDRLA
jgi:hypothetical protein